MVSSFQTSPTRLVLLMLRDIRCFIVQWARRLCLGFDRYNRQAAGSHSQPGDRRKAPTSKRRRSNATPEPTETTAKKDKPSSPSPQSLIPSERQICVVVSKQKWFQRSDASLTSRLTSKGNAYEITYSLPNEGYDVSEKFGFKSLDELPNEKRPINKRFEEGTLYLYSDASYKKEKGLASAGVGMFYGFDEDGLNWGKKIPKRMECDESRGEILAVLLGLNRLLHWKESRNQKVVVRVDRLEVIQGILLCKTGVATKDEYGCVWAVAAFFVHGVQLQWVQTHTDDDPANAKADQLAGEVANPNGWTLRCDQKVQAWKDEWTRGTEPRILHIQTVQKYREKKGSHNIMDVYKDVTRDTKLLALLEESIPK
ncbi:unnamed protein product, partial [Mesorhabditis belari]|uniref:RNase H type-1 domain-containing protein n=1 Tax=Mesorhabditis belari TaxID=2138241 RepID=A0AAF3J4R9_9BILA